jgi:hypothetical protein
VFPAGVEGLWAEARGCRHSHEHELRHVRVLASPTALVPYLRLHPAFPYPAGATLVKLEYDDAACTNLLGYTAMLKEPPGARPAGGDWRWQRLDMTRRVIEDGAPPVCLTCHVHHCAAAGQHRPGAGYDLTCGEEL